MEVADVANGGRTTKRQLLQLAGKGEGCVWHDGCDQTVVDPLTSIPGQFCAKGAFCEVCSFCQSDTTDAVDGVCPMSMCPGSGRLPECVSAQKLADAHWKCQDTYAFEVWQYGAAVDGAPNIAPSPSPPHRFITPGNEVIGAVGMAVRRGKPGACPAHANSDLRKFAKVAGACISSSWDSAPYSFDSIFLASSTLYDGNLRMQDYYSAAERRNATDTNQRRASSTPVSSSATNEEEGGKGMGMPFAFFPHSYDTENRMTKNESFIVPEFKDSYMVFLDSRLSSSLGSQIVALLQQGRLLDEQVKEVDFYIPVMNAQLMVLGLATVHMHYEDGGSIDWDYDFKMMRTAPYSTGGNSMNLSFPVILLQTVVILMVLSDIVLSVREMWAAFRTYGATKYIMSPGSWLDWTSHILQIYYWSLWILVNIQLNAFELKTSATYAPLASTNGSARWLASNAPREQQWLQLVLQLQSLLAAEAHAYAILGFAVLIFLFRILSACHFQPRWANVTGTLLRIIPDIINYLILYLIVIGGYACVGMQLFGHQFKGMSTFAGAMQLLFDFLLTMDYLQLWFQMQHAAANDVTFQLYIWSFIVIGFLIMFNIFLCIVVDGYMCSKETMEAAMNTTVGDDLRSTSDMIWKMMTKPRELFWSDGYLESILRIQTKAEGIPCMLELREHINSAFETHTKQEMMIKGVTGGVRFSIGDVKRLTAVPSPTAVMGLPMFGGQQSGAAAMLNAVDEEEESSDDDSASESDSDVGDMVEDVMKRYNEQEDAADIEKDMLEVIRLESMTRKVAMTQQMSWMIPKVQRAAGIMSRIALEKGLMLPPKFDAGLQSSEIILQTRRDTKTDITSDESVTQSNADKRVRISKMRARSLPSHQPLFGSADPYVLMFIKDSDEDVDQTQVKKTQHVKPTDEVSWINETIDLPFPEASDENTLCLIIYTFDNISTDQLLGSVQISVEQLPNHVMGKKAKYRVCDVLNRQLPRREMARARLSVCAEVWTLAQIAEQEKLDKGEQELLQQSQDAAADVGGDGGD
mmetsp:Transcript_43899/g.64456  ORF Transcript_43899/g.64456 Transcript_43899/m.64456 type:complete len:1032 (-) Transcript_43899:352-3447(-)